MVVRRCASTCSSDLNRSLSRWSVAVNFDASASSIALNLSASAVSLSLNLSAALSSQYVTILLASHATTKRNTVGGTVVVRKLHRFMIRPYIAAHPATVERHEVIKQD